VEDAGAPPSWRNDGLPKVFAYLRTEYRGWDALINALGAAQLDTFLVVPGASPHLLESCRVKGLRLVSSPAHIATARATCDAAICHASDGIVSAFLLAGKPLLLLPNHMEQLMVARSVVELGAGVVCAPADDEKTLIGSLRALLNKPSYAERAQAFAAKYASVSPETTVALLAEGIENCLATRRPMNDLARQIEV
jgi:UDP:flavonoid glycosyltransferase YjiC (YdhE family)